MRSMTILVGRCAFTGLMIACLTDSAHACGSVAQSFSAMMLETDKARLETFLEDHTCAEPARYSPDTADRYIAVVLLHAVRAGVSVDLVATVFGRYHCVARLAPYSGHRQIMDYIGKKRVLQMCPEDKLLRLYIVSAEGGANLRRAPGEDAAVIGAMAEGVAVENGWSGGEWIRVDTYLGRGYMHRSTLRHYIPPIDD